MKAVLTGTLVLLLLSLGPTAVRGQEPELPDILEALRDGNGNQRGNACNALAKLGPKAKEAVPALIKALKDADLNVRKLAGNALEKIGEAAVPELVLALRDKDEFTRRRVVIILGNIGPDAREALGALNDAQSDPDPYVKQAAVDAWVRVKGDIGTLLKNLKDKDEGIRAVAAKTLGINGVQARSAVGPLGDALKDKSAKVRQEAAKALGRIGQELRNSKDFKTDREIQEANRTIGEAVRHLAGVLGDADEDVRVAVAVALGEIGPPASAALPALKLAHSKDKNEQFRKAVVEAADKIEGRKPTGVRKPGGAP